MASHDTRPAPDGTAGEVEYDPRVLFYRRQIATQVKGRPVILCMGLVAVMGRVVRDLAALGAGPFCLLAYGIGAGDLPDEALAEWHIVGELPPGLTMSEELNAYNRMLADLPPAVRAAVDRFDPDGRALVLTGLAVDAPSVAGRPDLGPREPAWIALEDKTVIDALWDRLGVPRVPSRVVPVAEAAAAHRALDVGSGTVWAADARDGFNGGAAGTRWIRDGSLIDEALAFFGPRADTVRVMPFLEGIPCSIHGLILGDEIAVLRPCEMVVLRHIGESRFCYGGASTCWDPPPADRDAMRATARVVAEGLRALYGYRGMFTIDGVMTADGFRPTELNPRFGAAAQVQANALRGLSLFLLNRFARAGIELDWRAAELEQLVVSSADAHREGGGWTVAGGCLETTTTHDIVWVDDHYRLAEPGETADGTLMAGPAPSGTFIRYTPASARIPVGSSIAPRVEQAFRLAEAEMGVQIGRLEPAKDVRR